MIPVALFSSLYRAAQLKRLHGPARETLQGYPVPFGHTIRMRLGIDDAQRADPPAIFGLQRRAGVEADADVTGDKRVRRKAIVLRRIVHDHRIVAMDRVRAERDRARRLRRCQTDLRLEPLPVLIDQRNKRDRRAKYFACIAHDRVELHLVGRVKDTIPPQRRQAVVLVLSIVHIPIHAFRQKSDVKMQLSSLYAGTAWITQNKKGGAVIQVIVVSDGQKHIRQYNPSHVLQEAI